MKAIEVLGLMALVTLIYNVSLFFIKYKRKVYMNKEQVTIEAKLNPSVESAKLKEHNEFLKSEIEKFVKICDDLTAANKKCLDEFEAYVRLTQGEQEKPVKRSVTSLKEKECIRIGEGDWAKLAPLFEDVGIVWWKGQKASEIIPEIGGCVSVNYYGKNELTQDEESFYINDGFTILPASDFIEDAKGVIEEMPTAKEILEYHFDTLFEKPEPAIDWSVPQAFPEGYEMKKGTQVIAIKSFFNVPIGKKGVVMEDSWISYIDWEGGQYRSHDVSAIRINGGVPYRSEQLAPLNPTDHPNHPDHVKR